MRPSCYDPVMARRKYLQDYEIITKPDKQGRETAKLEYCGDFYEVLFHKGSLSSYRNISLLVLLLTLALHVYAGFINNDGMRQFYVLIPYAIAYLPYFNFSAGIINIPGRQPAYRRDQIELSFKRIRSANFYLVVLLTTIVVSECVYLLFFTSGVNLHLDHLFLLLELLAAVALWMYARVHKNTLIKKQTEE